MRAILPTIRAVAAAVLLLAAAFAIADDDGATKLWQSKVAKLGKTAAARLWEAAEVAKRQGLFHFARDEAARVVEFDPEHRPARALLGYVRKEMGWVMDPDLWAKTPGENQLPPGTMGKLADVERTWKANVAARADADVAAMWAALGDECVAKGIAAGTKAAYEKALALDPGNAAARKGLGFFKFGDGLWMSKEAKLTYDADRIPTPVSGMSRWEEIVGATMVKAESEHFHAETPFPGDSVAKYLDAGERANAAILADLGLPPDTKTFPQKAVLCVLSDDKQWDLWINKVVRGNQGFLRGLAVNWAQDRGAVAVRNSEGSTEETRCDRIIHQTIHLVNASLWSIPDGCWVGEALAYRYPVILTGTTTHYCVGMTKDDYGSSGNERSWLDASAWKDLLRESVTKGDDKALRAIVSKSAYQLPLACSIKAWSVCGWLIAKDRAAFVAMLGDVKGATNLVSILENRFGKPVEQLDDEWRQWVLAGH
jgi:hypothetical protein